jgi:ribosome-associated toxin RatA of RatAB toxin-antitoxin module
MTVVQRTAVVPFTPAQMYRLVNDVKAYPQFLPWCARADVLAEGPGFMRARLAIRKGPLDYAFTTENRLEEDRSIEMSLVEGPFSKLHGVWRFEPQPGGCLVRLELEFEFAGRALSAILSKAFKPVADSLVAAFQARAHAVYGGR